MKNCFLICFIIVLSYSCKTNNYIKYHRIINEAEYSFFNEDYRNATQLYERAFNKVRISLESDVYFYAASLWEIGEQKKSIALMDTMFYLEWTLTKSGYFQGMDSLIVKELIRQNEKKIASINQKRDSEPLHTVFDSINERDQKYRNKLEVIRGDKEKEKEVIREIAIADSLNLITVDSLIKIHGFVGGVYFPANPRIMHLFLMHSLEWVYQNPRLFKKAIKQGRLLPQDYAIVYDKALLLYVGDTIVRYGQFNGSKLQGVRPEKVFKDARKIGVSPYFNKWIDLPKKKGKEPKKHFFYDYYTEKKSSFSCY